MTQTEIELDDDLRNLGIRRLLLRQHHLARSIKLKLSNRGEVIIVYPTRQPIPDWKQLIVCHHQWLALSISRLNLSDNKHEQPEIISLTAIGKIFSIDYSRHTEKLNRYHQNAEKLHISHNDSVGWQPVLKRWLTSQAKAELIPWLEQVSTRIELPFRKVTIRNQRQRWGSCNQYGDISLNVKLLLLQPEIVEYLFIHELCHTTHMNHSKKYWQLVESRLPNWREYDHQLQKAMSQLPHWIF